MKKCLTSQNVPLTEGVDGRKARRGRILAVLLFSILSLSLPAQTPQLQGQWQLLSVTRSEGTIVYYNWNNSKALNASPVVWGFGNGIAAILNDTTLTPYKLPTDTVEAAHYHFSGDTLVMENYFTKGEAETSTNAPVVKYKIEKATADELLLILYDTGYYNAIRAIDKYSKRYVFDRIVVPQGFCFNGIYNRIPNSELKTKADTINRVNYVIAMIDTCTGYSAKDSLTLIYSIGMKADVYWEVKEYKKCVEYSLVLIPMMEAYSKSRGGDHTGGRVSAELYYKLGYCQIKIGQQRQGCLNLKKAVELRNDPKHSRALNEFCN